MRTLVYQHPHRLGKIQDELLAALPALRAVLVRPTDDAPTAVLLVGGDGVTLTLQVPDSFTDDASIQAVVDAHDPTTPSAWEQTQATAATNEGTLKDRLTTILSTLEAANTNWTTLTAAQKDAALRACIRAAAALIRLLLRRLDAAG